MMGHPFALHPVERKHSFERKHPVELKMTFGDRT
jgi:hypothetical protein